MKKYEEETNTYMRLVETTCDCCHNAIRHRDRSFEVFEASISARRGDDWPEGFHGENYKPDICEQCFTDKIIPALVRLGIDVPWVEE